MRRFKSPGQAQRFLSAFGPIRDHFHPKQHQLSAKRYREQLRQRFQDGRQVAHLETCCVKLSEPDDEGLDLLREWQIRGFKLLGNRAKNRFAQEV